MKQLIVIALTAVQMMAGCSPVEVPQEREVVGTYYDYLVVKTEDGNEYLLDDSMNSPYIKDSKVIFADGQQVNVEFDTCGTLDTTDDMIVGVRVAEKLY